MEISPFELRKDEEFLRATNADLRKPKGRIGAIKSETEDPGRNSNSLEITADEFNPEERERE